MLKLILENLKQFQTLLAELFQLGTKDLIELQLLSGLILWSPQAEDPLPCIGVLYYSFTKNLYLIPATELTFAFSFPGLGCEWSLFSLLGDFHPWISSDYQCLLLVVQLILFLQLFWMETILIECESLRFDVLYYFHFSYFAVKIANSSVFMYKRVFTIKNRSHILISQL